MIRLTKEFESRMTKRKEKDEKQRKKIKRIHFQERIKLNIGGKRFETTLQTIRACAGSMLAAMFSGNFNMEPGEDGAYFIDRDGEMFVPLLNYLRTGLFAVPEDEILRDNLYNEADFYGLQPVCDIIRPPPPPSPLNFGSMVANEQDFKWLKSQIPESKNFELLYRASRDGQTAQGI